MNTKYKYTDLYSLTRCLGLHSKICATQMNTSDNPIELWDIQLSSRLFCELTLQLCSSLMASSCYFKTSHTMHAWKVSITTQGLAYDARGDFVQASAGRLPVTNPWTSDHWQCSAGFLCTTLHARAYNITHIYYRKRLFTDSTAIHYIPPDSKRAKLWSIPWRHIKICA